MNHDSSDGNYTEPKYIECPECKGTGQIPECDRPTNRHKFYSLSALLGYGPNRDKRGGTPGARQGQRGRFKRVK
jgi:hypothetical protein